jgi:hypothetical protein
MLREKHPVFHAPSHDLAVGLHVPATVSCWLPGEGIHHLACSRNLVNGRGSLRLNVKTLATPTLETSFLGAKHRAGFRCLPDSLLTTGVDPFRTLAHRSWRQRFWLISYPLASTAI